MDFESIPLLGLFDQLVTSNTCPITAATYLEILYYIGQCLLIDVHKTPAYGSDPYIDNPSALYVNAISEDVSEKWKAVVQTSSLPGNRPGINVLDPLTQALARVKVVLGLLTLKHKPEEYQTRVLGELSGGGEFAFTAGLQTVKDLLAIIPSLKMMPVSKYYGVLLKASGSDSKVCAMQTWTKMLAFEALSTSSTDSILKMGRQPWCTHGKYIEIMERDDPARQNAALTLRGALMAYEHRLEDPSDPLFTCDMEVWCQMLKLAGDERSVSFL